MTKSFWRKLPFYQLFFVLLAMGCAAKTGTGDAKVQAGGQAQGIQIPTRFGLALQVEEDSGKNRIPGYSASLIGAPASVFLVNPFGDTEGNLYVSNPGANAVPVSVEVLIAAQGYLPRIVKQTVYPDCNGVNCLVRAPISIGMQERIVRVADAPREADYVVSDLVRPLGLAKLDATTSEKLGAMPEGATAQILVLMAETADPSQTAALFQKVLARVDSSPIQGIIDAISGIATLLLPIITAINPAIGAIVGAVLALLPYIKQIIDAIRGPNVPAAARLLGMTANRDGDEVQRTSTGSVSLADPILYTFDPDDDGAVPVASSAETILAAYMKPLLQGLKSSMGSAIASQFNALVAAKGMAGLRGFPADEAEANRYNLLASFLLPLVKGLQGTDGPVLEQLLSPLLAKADPAGAILSTFRTGIFQKLRDFLAKIFPGLNQNLKAWVPSKNLLTAQIFQGRNDQHLKQVSVVEDYPGTPAVVIRATREEVYRLIQLPNVEQIIWRAQ